MSEKKKQVGVMLPFSLYKRARIEAVKRDISLAEFIRLALIDFLDKRNKGGKNGMS